MIADCQVEAVCDASMVARRTGAFAVAGNPAK